MEKEKKNQQQTNRILQTFSVTMQNQHSQSLLAQKIDIQQLIKQLKDYGQISKHRLYELIQISQKDFINQPNILPLCSPVRIVGDIHGQFHDLLHIFDRFGQLPKNYYLFLGDYVDRGLFCIEVITLLLALKVKYPYNIFMLRGNHQGRTMTECFNFKLQCLKKYDIDVYERFLDLFCKLPICAIVDNRYFCVHGGISPQLKKISSYTFIIEQIDNINRFKQLQSAGLICDLLWSDPVNTTTQLWERNKSRSCSFVYGRKQAEKFLQQNRIQLIIRGHEVQAKGYAYQLSDMRRRLTLTVFSAPNYCDTYKNKGGISIINKNLLTLQNFSQNAHPFIFPNYMNVLEWSLPLITTQASQMFMHLLKMMDVQQKPLTQQQITVFNKLKYLSDMLETMKTNNFQLLFQNDHYQNIKQDSVQFQDIFTLKKGSDHAEKYPCMDHIVIGPKNIQFDKISLENLEFQQSVQPLSNQELQT